MQQTNKHMQQQQTTATTQHNSFYNKNKTSKHDNYKH